MALFTNEDAERLLLVSQLVQLELMDTLGGEPEISAFVKQWHHTGTLASPATIVEMVINKNWSLQLQHLGWLRELSKLILGTLADRGKIFHDELDALNYESERFPSSRILLTRTEERDAEGYIDPANLEETWGAKGVMDIMFITIIQQLQTACLHPERVRRCEVCCSPYLLQRATGKNKFCSHRCGQRHYDRKRKNNSKHLDTSS